MMSRHDRASARRRRVPSLERCCDRASARLASIFSRWNLAIEAWARDGGFAHPCIEATTRNAGGNRIRLTCRVPMLDRITDPITQATTLAEQRQDEALVADLSIALMAALEGRDEAVRPQHVVRWASKRYTG